MKGSELKNVFLSCSPVDYYDKQYKDSYRFDYIKKIIYYWKKDRCYNGDLVEVIKISCQLAYNNINSTLVASINDLRIVKDSQSESFIPFEMDERILKLFQEKEQVTVNIAGKTKFDFKKINELILEMNDDKNKITIKCACGEGLSRVEELATNVEPKKSNERINYKFIIDLFNKTCPELPKVQKLTESRKSAIKTAKESGIDFVSFFLKIHKSDFLSGRNKKWKNCNFDWCLKLSNRIKILEGNFDNNRQEQEIKKTTSYDIEELEKIQ